MSFTDKFIINTNLIPRPSRRRGGQRISKVRFLVAHDTGNPGSSAAANVKYYINTAQTVPKEKTASAHLFVDDKEILECVPALTAAPEKAWHVLYKLAKDNELYGVNANDAAIGVEYCYGGNIDADKAYEKYVWVLAKLCYVFGLDASKDITGHFFLDPKRKTDPLTGLAHSRRSYERLLKDVVKEYNECTGNSPAPSFVIIPQQASYTTTVKLNLRSKPTTKSDVIQVLAPHTPINCTAIVQNGEGINNNPVWYVDANGNFLWSGGVTDVAPVPAIHISPPFLPVPGAPLKTTDENIEWWVQALGLPLIWNDFKETGDKAKIAVLDSGYNTVIPDVANGVAESKVFFKSVAGLPVTINDTFGHGTHCASLIGSRNNNLVCGCAPASQLYIAKICSQGSVRSFSIMVDAIKWAIEKKVDVISISYGGESNDASLEAIIKKAVNEHNIIVIAAIGDTVINSANKACFPALLNECIAVGATNQQQQIAAITILNDKTEINAPGENIAAYELANHPSQMSGTSQATAIIAGICALIISKHKNLGKAYTVKSIRDLITQNADNIPGSNQKIISPFKIFPKI